MALGLAARLAGQWCLLPFPLLLHHASRFGVHPLVPALIHLLTHAASSFPHGARSLQASLSFISAVIRPIPSVQAPASASAPTTAAAARAPFFTDAQLRAFAGPLVRATLRIAYDVPARSYRGPLATGLSLLEVCADAQGLAQERSCGL